MTEKTAAEAAVFFVHVRADDVRPYEGERTKGLSLRGAKRHGNPHPLPSLWQEQSPCPTMGRLFHVIL